MATLDDYATALELAFDANLLVAAWATLYKLFNMRFKALSDEADRFADEPLLEEEVGIAALRRTSTGSCCKRSRDQVSWRPWRWSG